MADVAMARLTQRIRNSLTHLELQQLSDRDLLNRFLKNHQEEAFTELVQRHQKLVQSAVGRVLTDPHQAEDAFQATFLVLVRRAKSIPWQSGLGPWLYGVAHRIAIRARQIDQNRQRREKRAVEQKETSTLPTDITWREAGLYLSEALHPGDGYTVTLIADGYRPEPLPQWIPKSGEQRDFGTIQMRRADLWYEEKQTVWFDADGHSRFQLRTTLRNLVRRSASNASSSAPRTSLSARCITPSRAERLRSADEKAFDSNVQQNTGRTIRNCVVIFAPGNYCESLVALSQIRFRK